MRAPLDVCLERVAGRDQSHQIPVDLETVRKVHELSESLQLDADLVIENDTLSDADLVGLFARVLRDR